MGTLLATINSDISGIRDVKSGLTYQIVDRREWQVYLGTALRQASMLWSTTFSIPKEDSVVLDLSALTDVDGQTVELQFIRALRITADKENLMALTVQPNATDGFASICDGPLSFDPDSNMLFVNMTGNGWSLANGGKLAFVNVGTVSSLSCTVTVIGV